MYALWIRRLNNLQDNYQGSDNNQAIWLVKKASDIEYQI